MKKLFISAIALAAAMSATPTLAADLPSLKGPPPVYLPPPPLWTGFYVGVNAGGTWSASNSIQTFGTDAFDFPGTFLGAAAATSATSWLGNNSNGGFIGGGQVGYNYQFGPNFVAGIEADIQGVATSNNGGTQNAFGIGFDPITGDTLSTVTQANKSLDYLGTVRGRLGDPYHARLGSLYATGGLAYGGANASNLRDRLVPRRLFAS